MAGTIQTVRGPVSSELLGKTMTHEHLLWDQTCWWPGDPDEITFRRLVHQQVCLENRGWVYYNAHRSLDNIVQYDLELAIAEASQLKRAGGSALVDVTSLGLGRDPRALLAISEAAGLHVVMGSGYYVASALPQGAGDPSKERIAEQIVREFAEGVKDTGIKPGVIGEISISDLNNPLEVMVLEAGAIAQRHTGAPFYIHPPIFDTHGLAVLDIVEGEGADLSKVVMCHCDPTIGHPDYHDAMARRGVYLEYDQFGLEFPVQGAFLLPRDIERIRAIRGQIDRGHISQILVSQDVCFKICLLKYGGWGYAHILRNMVPFMRAEGISSDSLEMILVANPRRMLTL